MEIIKSRSGILMDIYNQTFDAVQKISEENADKHNDKGILFSDVLRVMKLAVDDTFAGERWHENEKQI